MTNAELAYDSYFSQKRSRREVKSSEKGGVGEGKNRGRDIESDKRG